MVKMAQAHAAPTGLAQAIGRFPERARQLRQLAQRDEGFRGLCEDYALARASLARFEALPNSVERPEIADYRQVIAELEREIETALNRARSGRDVSAEGKPMRERSPEE